MPKDLKFVPEFCHNNYPFGQWWLYVKVPGLEVRGGMKWNEDIR